MYDMTDALEHRNDEIVADAFEVAGDDPLVIDDYDRHRHSRLSQVVDTERGTSVFTLVVDDGAEKGIREAVAKMDRKVKRWGGEVKIIAEDEQFVEHWLKKRGPDGKIKMVRQLVLTIETPALLGTSRTKLVGTFELAEDGVEVYRHALGDADPAILEPYLIDNRWKGCDHCGYNRDRHSTFLCELEDGSLKLVGRQCSQDYLGLEPADILARDAIYRTIVGKTDEEDGGWGGSWTNTFHVESLVRRAYRVCKRHGGYSRDASDKIFNDIAALEGAVDFGRSTHYRDIRAFYKALPEPEPLDLIDLAEFVEKMDGDYGQNVRIAFGCEYAKMKRRRIVVSGVGVYVGKLATRKQRLEQEARDAASRPAAKHLDGKVGDRLTIVAKVDRTNPFNNNFGGGVVVSMTTADGAKLVHFSTLAFTPEVGKTYAVKATIKDHAKNRINGSPETIVTRCAYTEATEGSLI